MTASDGVVLLAQCDMGTLAVMCADGCCCSLQRLRACHVQSSVKSNELVMFCCHPLNPLLSSPSHAVDCVAHPQMLLIVSHIPSWC